MSEEDARLVAKAMDQGAPRTGISDSDRTEAARRSIEERLRLAQEAAGLGAWEYEPESGAFWFSPEYLHLYGVSPTPTASFDMDQWLAALHPDDRERMRAARSAMLRTGHLDEEFRIFRLDTGELRWLHSKAARLDRPSGPMLIGINHDITARKLAIEAARERDQRLRMAFAAAGIFAWDWDVTTGRVEWSEGGETALRLPPGGFGGTVEAFRALVHPDDRAGVEAALARALSGADSEYVAEFRMRRGDGTWRHSATRGSVQRDATGRPVRVFGVDHDLSARTAAQEASEAHRWHEAQARAALERSKAQFERAAEVARLAAYEVGADKVARVTRSFWGLYGLSPETHFDFDTLLTLVHPDDRPRVIADHERLAQDGGSFRAEFRIVRPDGSVGWLETRGIAQPGTMGFPSGIQGILLDITDRKQSDAALRRSEARFRSFVEASSQVIWTMSADGVIVEPIPSWQAYTGQSFEAARGLGFLDAIHRDDRAAVLASWNEAIARGDFYEVDYRLRRRDGAWRQVAARGVPVRDSGGAILEWIGTCVDVTERKVAEAALQESEARFRAMTNVIPQLVWTCDPTGPCTHVNEQWLAYTGVSAEQHLGYGWLDAVHPEDRARLAEAWQASLAGGPDFDTEARLRASDGTYRWFKQRAVAVRAADGAVAQWFGTSTDIQEIVDAREILMRDKADLERRVEERSRELRQAHEHLAHYRRMEALGQLAGGIAHDFNNVLQAVLGGIRLIEKRADDVEVTRRLSRMVADAVDRGASVTRRLLAFSRRDELRADAVDPASLLQEMQEVLTHTLGAGIGVGVRIAPDLPDMMVDKAQLETVLINLATNARDAMDGNGSLTLAASADAVPPAKSELHSALKAGHYVRIAVIDSGRGMPSKVLAHATEPFFTTKPHGEGTGLGLAMARGFAEQSGGALHIESAVGEGTTVSLWFPVATTGAITPMERDGGPTLRPGRRQARLMVVDDEPVVRDVLAETLRQCGYAVLAFGSAAEGLAAIDAGERVDLVISDLSMPGIDGVAFVREMHRREPGLPAIILTGFATDAAAIAFSGALTGAFSLLRKPVTDEQLADRVAAMLETVAAARD